MCTFTHKFCYRPNKSYGDEAPDIQEWIKKHLCSDMERHHIKLNQNQPNEGAEILRGQYFDFMRRTRYAWCWFESGIESAAMWSIYGNQGVAIQTTIDKLLTALEKREQEFIYGRMTYIDYRMRAIEINPESETDYYLLLHPFFLKRREYESEREVRFITAAPTRGPQSGFRLSGLNPNEWISAIRLWPGLTSDEESSLCNAIKPFLSHPDIRKSDLHGASIANETIKHFKWSLEKAADTDWREGKDGIPKLLKML